MLYSGKFCRCSLSCYVENFTCLHSKIWRVALSWKHAPVLLLTSFKVNCGIERFEGSSLNLFVGCDLGISLREVDRSWGFCHIYTSRVTGSNKIVVGFTNAGFRIYSAKRMVLHGIPGLGTREYFSTCN